jgi:hypothetical protein
MKDRRPPSGELILKQKSKPKCSHGFTRMPRTHTDQAKSAQKQKQKLKNCRISGRQRGCGRPRPRSSFAEPKCIRAAGKLRGRGRPHPRKLMHRVSIGFAFDLEESAVSASRFPASNPIQWPYEPRIRLLRGTRMVQSCTKLLVSFTESIA